VSTSRKATKKATTTVTCVIRRTSACAVSLVDGATTVPLAGGGDQNLFVQFRRNQSGNFTIITALVLPVLIGIAGLGTEAGLWSYKHQTMQSAADSAAFSAGTSGNRTNLAAEAGAVTASYGFVNGANGAVVTVNQPPKSGSHLTTPGAVEVIVTQTQARLFSAIYSSQPVTISARAVAIGGNGGGCVLALNTAASGAAAAQGSTSVNLIGCSLYDNSSNGSALTVGGSATISALSVSVVGHISGQASITTTKTNGITTGATPANDPYASNSYPPFLGCDQNNFTAKNAVTIDPGVYCDGMQLNAGANVTLNPGTYYINQGSLQVNGSATLTGNGVTLVFTSSTGLNYPTATINGGATVNLSAPTSGPTAGIAIFGDRNMPVGTSFKFNGGSSQVISGAIYVPKGAVNFAGGANSANGCTQLIADTVTFSGNSNFAINCSGYGTKSLGVSATTLVE
jgi:Flp pilus assembly protein TadG